MTTIFDGVIRKENDHTNLLRNVLESFPVATAAILSCLTGNVISEAEASGFTYETQHCFVGPEGRDVPDLTVRREDFFAIIEAKVDPLLGLSERQLAGYRSCFNREKTQHLAFFGSL